MNAATKPDVWQSWGPFYHLRGHIWAKGTPRGEAMLFQVRAWGFLTGAGHGALLLAHQEAAAIQDHMGDTLAALLNERFPPVPA